MAVEPRPDATHGSDVNKMRDSRDTERDDRLRQVISEHFQKWAAGTVIAVDQVIAEHPDLMPELGERLRQAQFIQQAAAAPRPDDSAAATEEFIGTNRPVGDFTRGLHIRCPHCRQAMELTADVPFDDVTCSACGSTFSLVSHPADTQGAPPLRQVAKFELVGRLGMGNFGTVWKARDVELDRTVAVKIPRRGQLDPHEEEKFLREARAAAQLRHPNIVAVHEVGREGDTLYIVSDFVRGVTLADWMTARRLTHQEIATLCTKLADALHHAHERGVVHRDLKPSNVMLDADGEPHIMDFGLAKRAAGEITMTLEGQILGTPAYMSPEQARGEGVAADRRSDIYSLGVMLFELLTGELPFRGNPRMLVFQVIHDEPPSPRKLEAHVPRDLETICLKCLEKEPRKRYQTTAELADEFRRFAEGRPILSRRISKAARAWRWCKRNPTAAALLGLMMAVAVVAPLVAFNQWVLSNRAQQEADRADAERAEVLTQRDRLRRLLYVAHINMAQQALEEANVVRAVELLSRYQDSDLRDFEWRYLWRETHRHAQSLSVDPSGAVAVALSPDGETLAAAGAGGKIVLWNVSSGKRTGEFPTPRQQITSIAFLQNGHNVVTGNAVGAVCLWDVATGELLETLGKHASRVNAVAVDDAGNRVASASSDKIAAVWDVESGDRLHQLEHVWIVTSLAFLDDGARLATGSRDSLVRVWNLESGEAETLLDHDKAVTSFAVDQQEHFLISSIDDGSLTYWDLTTGQARHKWEGHLGGVTSLALSDAGMLLSAGRDGLVKLWDPAEPAEWGVARGHSGGVNGARFLHGGQSFATAGQEGTVKIWTTEEIAKSAILRPHQQMLVKLRIVPGSLTPISIGHDSATQWEAKRWRLASDDPAATLVNSPLSLWSMAISPDGASLAVSRTGEGSEVVVCDAATGETVRELKTPQKMIKGLAFLSNDQLAVADIDGTVLTWDLSSTDEPERLQTDDDFSYRSLASAANGRWLAAGTASGSVVLWDMPTAQHQTLPAAEVGSMEALAFSPDAMLLAAAGPGNMATLWQVGAREPMATLRGHGQAVTAVAFTSDGRTLATGTSDGTVILWDVATRESKLVLSTEHVPVQSLAFTFDDKTLLAGRLDGGVHVWRGDLPAARQAAIE